MLDKLFSPNSIAVVGVSLEKEKLGNQILKNILKAKFEGDVFPINKKATPSTYIENLRVYPNLEEIPGEVDLCVVVVPPQFVKSIIEDCGKKGVPFAVIITAGFKETGKEGAKLEEELVETAKKSNVRLLGPNVLGIINTHHRLNASFSPVSPSAGNIAFISQSGALGCTILDQFVGEEIGISKFISLGNKADLDEVDFIQALKDDPQTKVILGYLENVKRGKEFIQVVKETIKEKPIVMIKSGRSKAGKKAVSSHTGALAGADEAYEVTFKETGIIRAKTVSEAFDIVRGLSSQPIPKGDKVLLLTNAGGAGIMATDACEDYSIPLVSLSKDTINKLKDKLPPASSLSNPLDILGDADPDRFKVTLETVLPDPNIDAIILLVTPQTTTKPEDTAKVIVELCKNYEKPILGCFMGGEIINPGVKILRNGNIPNYKDPDAAVKVLRTMIDYSIKRRKKEESVKKFEVKKSKVKCILDEQIEKEYYVVGGAKALEIMNAYGIPTVENHIAKDAEEAVRIAEKIPGPVVMKIESPAIIHKSDIGGVKTNLTDEKIKEAFYEIMKNAKKALKNENEIIGVSIQPMIKEGKEILIGAIHDDIFGHLIRFGLGGKYVEAFRDFSTRLVPLYPSEAKEIIKETRIASKLLQGFRDEPPSDINLIEESLLRLSQLVQDFPQIEEVEANPLVVWEKGGLIIDARLKLTKKED